MIGTAIGGLNTIESQLATPRSSPINQCSTNSPRGCEMRVHTMAYEGNLDVTRYTLTPHEVPATLVPKLIFMGIHWGINRDRVLSRVGQADNS